MIKKFPKVSELLQFTELSKYCEFLNDRCIEFEEIHECMFSHIEYVKDMIEDQEDISIDNM